MLRWFTGPRRATPRDVVGAYGLLLGRAPESRQAVDDKLALTLQGLFDEILSSREFREKVFADLVSYPDFPSRFDEPVSPDLASWTSGALDGRKAADPGLVSWGRLLAEAIKSARVANSPNAPGLNATERKKLALWRSRSAATGLKGALETVERDLIQGWVVDAFYPWRVSAVNLEVDGRFVRTVTPDLFRRDLQDRFGGGGVCGFSLELLPGEVDAQARRVVLQEPGSGRPVAEAEFVGDMQERISSVVEMMRARKDLRRADHDVVDIDAALNVAKDAASFPLRGYDAYRLAFQSRSSRDAAIERERSAAWLFKPRFVFNVSPSPDVLAQATVDSLEAQTYARWSVSGQPNTDTFEPSSAGARYIIDIAPGDRLEPDALFRLGEALQSTDRPLVLHTDEDELRSVDGRPFYCNPRFGSSFDDLLLMQTGRLDGLVAVEGQLDITARTVAAEGRGPNRLLYILAATDQAGSARTLHIPGVMVHRNRPKDPYDGALARASEAVRGRLRSSGLNALVTDADDLLGASVANTLRIRPTGRAAINATVIIPTRDRLDLLRPCIEGIKSTYRCNHTPFKVLIIDNGSRERETKDYLADVSDDPIISVIYDQSPFNWAGLNNMAAARCDSEILIFLNNDTIPIARNWCDELSFWANWPGVGAVGTRLTYGDGTLQHAGLASGVWGVAANEGVGVAGSDPGYLGRHALTRHAQAVTGACLAVRREVFEALGGFDAASYAVNYNDLDYCLRARAEGLSIIYAPQAAFHHFESKSRRFDENLAPEARREREIEGERLLARWGDRLSVDSLYNPHFSRLAAPFSRLIAPPQ